MNPGVTSATCLEDNSLLRILSNARQDTFPCVLVKDLPSGRWPGSNAILPTNKKPVPWKAGSLFPTKELLLTTAECLTNSKWNGASHASEMECPSSSPQSKCKQQTVPSRFADYETWFRCQRSCSGTLDVSISPPRLRGLNLQKTRNPRQHQRGIGGKVST